MHHGDPDEAFSLDQVALVRDGRRILDGVTDHIHPAACTALVGSSGSGKSTLLRMLNRLEEPTSGVIYFRERPLGSIDVHELRRLVGLVGQKPVMLTGRVGSELRVARPDLDVDEEQALLERVALPGLDPGRETRSLSGGEQQRLALARALSVGPEVLLLDEPTSALDDEASLAVDRIIRDLVADGLTVVLVSHDLAKVRGVADLALVLDAGRLVERGDPGSVTYLTR